MNTSQAGTQWWALFELWIPIMCSFSITAVKQLRTFLNKWEIVLVQHTKLNNSFFFLVKLSFATQNADARPHTTARKLETIILFEWDELPHSPYSPDLSTRPYKWSTKWDSLPNTRRFCRSSLLTITPPEAPTLISMLVH